MARRKVFSEEELKPTVLLETTDVIAIAEKLLGRLREKGYLEDLM